MLPYIPAEGACWCLGSGSRFQGSGFRAWGFGFGLKVSGLGSGSRFQGSGLRCYTQRQVMVGVAVQGFALRAWVPAVAAAAAFVAAVVAEAGPCGSEAGLRGTPRVRREPSAAGAEDIQRLRAAAAAVGFGV